MLQNDVKWLFTYTGANMQLSAADFLHATNVLPVCITGNFSAALCSLLRGVRLTPAYHVPSWTNILPLCLRMRSNHKTTSNHMLLVSKEKIRQRGFEFRDENGSKPPAPLWQQKWLHSVSTLYLFTWMQFCTFYRGCNHYGHGSLWLCNTPPSTLLVYRVYLWHAPRPHWHRCLFAAKWRLTGLEGGS